MSKCSESMEHAKQNLEITPSMGDNPVNERWTLPYIFTREKFSTIVILYGRDKKCSCRDLRFWKPRTRHRKTTVVSMIQNVDVNSGSLLLLFFDS